DGLLVEVHPDSLETDSARKTRPTFKSDGGRVVYGGGAITPDLIVQPDTFSTAEQEFRKATAAKGPDMYVALYDYAFELSKQVKPDFTVPSAWRDELYSRLKKKGIDIDRKQYDGAAHYLDRLLENRVARLAF